MHIPDPEPRRLDLWKRLQQRLDWQYPGWRLRLGPAEAVIEGSWPAAACDSIEEPVLAALIGAIREVSPNEALSPLLSFSAAGDGD